MSKYMARTLGAILGGLVAQFIPGTFNFLVVYYLAFIFFTVQDIKERL